MKILWLPGAKCTKEIWRYMIKDWEEEDNVFVKYSHDVLLQAKQVMDITKDVYDRYGKASYDYIIGHSMGGKIALQLCADFQMRVKGIIFIEQPLRQHAHHFFFRFEMMIERPSCQSSQMIHNIKDGCILIAFFQKQFQRDIQYLFYRFFRIFISRHILTSFTYTLYVYNSIE